MYNEGIETCDVSWKNLLAKKAKERPRRRGRRVPMRMTQARHARMTSAKGKREGDGSSSMPWLREQ